MVDHVAKLCKCVFFMNGNIFRLLKLEIALVIPALTL